MFDSASLTSVVLSAATLNRLRRAFETKFRTLPSSAEYFLRTVDGLRQEMTALGVFEKADASCECEGELLELCKDDPCLKDQVAAVLRLVRERRGMAAAIKPVFFLRHAHGDSYHSCEGAIDIEVMVECHAPSGSAFEPQAVDRVRFYAVERLNKEKGRLLGVVALTNGHGTFCIGGWRLSEGEWINKSGIAWFRIEYEDYDGKTVSAGLTLEYKIGVCVPSVYSEKVLGEDDSEAVSFVGRAEQLKAMEDEFRTSRGGKGFLVMALRRLGKTSFLHRLKSRLGDEFYVSYQTLFGRSIESFTSMLSVFEAALELQVVGEPDVNVDARIQKITRTLKTSEKSVVIAIDEYSELYRYCPEGEAKRIEDFIRGILDAHLCHLVLCVQSDFPERIYQGNRYGSFGDPIDLKYLTQAESFQMTALIDEQLPDGTVFRRFSDDANAWLYDLTGGHPLFLQKVCKRTVRVLENLNVQTVTQDVRRLVEETLIPGFNKDLRLSDECRRLLAMRYRLRRPIAAGSNGDGLWDRQLASAYVKEINGKIDFSRDLESFRSLSLKDVVDEPRCLRKLYCSISGDYDYGRAARGLSTGRPKEWYCENGEMRKALMGLLNREIVEEVNFPWGTVVRLHVRLFAEWQRVNYMGGVTC